MLYWINYPVKPVLYILRLCLKRFGNKRGLILLIFCALTYASLVNIKNSVRIKINVRRDPQVASNTDRYEKGLALLEEDTRKKGRLTTIAAKLERKQASKDGEPGLNEIGKLKDISDKSAVIKKSDKHGVKQENLKETIVGIDKDLKKEEPKVGQNVINEEGVKSGENKESDKNGVNADKEEKDKETVVGIDKDPKEEESKLRENINNQKGVKSEKPRVGEKINNEQGVKLGENKENDKQKGVSESVKKENTPTKDAKTIRTERIRNAHFRNPLDFIPDISELYTLSVHPYIQRNVTAKYLELPNTNYSYKIVILTPIRNSEPVLERYANLVYHLKYPHHLVSVFFGENGSKDRTLEKAEYIANKLKFQGGFHDAGVVKLNISGGFHGNLTMRHEGSIQHYRRAKLATARNYLLEEALKKGSYDYVLWLDSDLVEIPLDLIEQMLFAKADVVATSCLVKHRGYKYKYDLNSWQETPVSLEAQKRLAPDKLLVEGYYWTGRLYLPDFKSRGRVVPLDGVGGCDLLVRADCHRTGLRFPDFVYRHQIETEGLAKMAKDLRYSVVGLPFVEVFHHTHN